MCVMSINNDPNVKWQMCLSLHHPNWQKIGGYNLDILYSCRPHCCALNTNITRPMSHIVWKKILPSILHKKAWIIVVPNMLYTPQNSDTHTLKKEIYGLGIYTVNPPWNYRGHSPKWTFCHHIEPPFYNMMYKEEATNLVKFSPLKFEDNRTAVSKIITKS